jgi:hypothetical protein
LVPIIVPIVAVITLAAWLGMVFWADTYSARKVPDRKCGRRKGGLMAKLSIELQPRKVEEQVGWNKALYHACRWSRIVSVATWFDFDKNERRVHYYVLLWLAALILILFLVPTSGWPGWVLVGVAFYRLQDLVFSTLDNVFDFTKRSKRSDKYDDPTLVVLALVNIIQIVLIFAIAYLVLISHNPRSFSNLPRGRFSDFYLSWIVLPPLGSGATPQSTMAKILMMTEEGTGLLIIVISIGRFLAAAPSGTRRLDPGRHARRPPRTQNRYKAAKSSRRLSR